MAHDALAPRSALIFGLASCGGPAAAPGGEPRPAEPRRAGRGAAARPRRARRDVHRRLPRPGPRGAAPDDRRGSSAANMARSAARRNRAAVGRSAGVMHVDYRAGASLHFNIAIEPAAAAPDQRPAVTGADMRGDSLAAVIGRDPRAARRGLGRRGAARRRRARACARRSSPTGRWRSARRSNC